VGAAPDVDFLLPIPHRGPTHSVGAAVIVLLVAWPLLAWRRSHWSGSPGRMALALAAACASHTLLDWLGADSSTPRGLMALWPWTSTYYISGLDVFNAVSRRYWLPGFWRSNTVAVLREIALLGPAAAGIGWFAARHERRAHPAISARGR
jgi:membrane-bound metal-dependent hydrolase YbcI (DUF457 family)